MTVRGERNPELVTLLMDRIKKPHSKGKPKGKDEQRGRLFARVRDADADVLAREGARAVPVHEDRSRHASPAPARAQPCHQRPFAAARSGGGRGATRGLDVLGGPPGRTG